MTPSVTDDGSCAGLSLFLKSLSGESSDSLKVQLNVKMAYLHKKNSDVQTELN